MLVRLLWSLILIIFLQLSAFGEENIIPFHAVPGRAYFESPQVTIDSAEYNTLILQIESKQSGTARIFWATHYNMQFSQPQSIWFSLRSGKHDYCFNIPSQNPNWIGWVRGFLVYPQIDPKLFEIKQARIISGNLITNIRSGWQEFWGPRGRKVIGSTINLTPASSIFGRSINVYIYWLTGIFFLATFAWKRSFYTAGRWAVYFALAAWVVLALNTDVNYSNIFKDNFSKYFGKSIEQKRAIAYGRDYYDFLVFAKDKLPKEPVHFGVLSSRYAPDLQARIFLVPHVLTDPKSPRINYLLVFNPEPKQISQLQGFSTFARLNKNAYLLKRTR